MFTHTSEYDVDLFCCLAYLFCATLHIFGQVYIFMFTHTLEHKVDVFVFVYICVFTHIGIRFRSLKKIYKVDLFSCLAYLSCAVNRVRVATQDLSIFGPTKK